MSIMAEVTPIKRETNCERMKKIGGKPQNQNNTNSQHKRITDKLHNHQCDKHGE